MVGDRSLGLRTEMGAPLVRLTASGWSGRRDVARSAAAPQLAEPRVVDRLRALDAEVHGAGGALPVGPTWTASG